MTPRYAALIAATIGLVVAACAATPVVPVPAPPTRTAPVVSGPAPTRVPVPATATPEPVATPDEGNVEGISYPELTVEPVDEAMLRIVLVDPTAKAWRLDIAGTGALAEDRLAIEVETGDVAPVITVTEIRGGQPVDVMDLSGYLDETAAAGGCHGTLGVCLDSDGFRLPQDGNGRFAVRVDVEGVTGPLTITGSTAGWPGEPFILGPWVVAEPFTWGA